MQSERSYIARKQIHMFGGIQSNKYTLYTEGVAVQVALREIPSEQRRQLQRRKEQMRMKERDWAIADLSLCQSSSVVWKWRASRLPALVGLMTQTGRHHLFTKTNPPPPPLLLPPQLVGKTHGEGASETAAQQAKNGRCIGSLWSRSILFHVTKSR